MATYTRWFQITKKSTNPDDLLAIEWPSYPALGKGLLKGLGKKTGSDAWPARRDALREALRAMPPEERFALLLHAVPNWAVDDVRERLGLPRVTTVQMTSTEKDRVLAKFASETSDALRAVPQAAWADHLRARYTGPSRYLEAWHLHVLLHALDPDAVPAPSTARLSLGVKVTYPGDQMPRVSKREEHRDLALRLLAFHDSGGALEAAVGGPPTGGTLPINLPILFETVLEGRKATEGTIHVLTDETLVTAFHVGVSADSTAW